MTPLCRDPLKLCPCVRRRHLDLVVGLSQGGVDTTLIETIRALDRQEHYVKIGASRTMKSKHLPQPPNNLSLAFDLAPTEYLAQRLWNPEGELWAVLGEAGQRLGLFWGGSWRIFPDNPHFQLEVCQCPVAGSTPAGSSPS